MFLPDVSGVSGGWFEARVPGPDLIIISSMRRVTKMVKKCFSEAGDGSVE
jgi:hypothetical protein